MHQPENPNDIPQVGGDHYRRNKKATYQHWDFCVDAGLGYLDGNSTKYLSRHGDKNGKQDLMKSWHYVMKLAEVANSQGVRPSGPSEDRSHNLRVIAVATFLATLPPDYAKERALIRRITFWQTVSELRQIALEIQALAEERYPDEASGAGPGYVGQ